MKNQSFKSLILLSLGLSWAGVALAADSAGHEEIEHGLNNVKQGTSEAVQGVGKAIDTAGKNANEVGQRVGRKIKAATCPIVGDRKNKIYYAADNKNYEAMLDGQKFLEDDDRACFMTEVRAREAGYTRAAN